MEKTVNLIVPAADPNSAAAHRQVVLNPNTTVNDIITQENLNGYDLSLGPNKPFLGRNDNLYDQVEQNGKIYATTQAVQG